MKTIITCVLCLMSLISATASTGRIRGQVIDSKTNEGMEYVHVAIKNAQTSEFVTGAVTDATGVFEIGNLNIGKFIVQVSTMGYTPIEREIMIADANALVNLSILSMLEDSKMLEEVEVVGQRSQMRFEIDKRIFNVDQSLATTGGSASDVLGNIPSVEVDTEGEISLRGNTSVTIWINGRASGLSAENRAQILEQLPAENIERVEIVTNPSARYNPEGTAGIINIILKQNRNAGYYGSLQAGVDTRGGYNMSGNINYSSGQFEAFLNLSHRVRKGRGDGFTLRNNLDGSGNILSFLNQTNLDTDKDGPYIARTGFTYHFTPKDHLSFSAMGMMDDEVENETMDYTGTIPGSYISSLRSSVLSDKMKLGSFELNYKREFTANSNLDLTVSRNLMWKDEENGINQLSQFADATESASYQFQDRSMNMKSWEIQADYVNSFTENDKLEAGYKADLGRDINKVETFSGLTPETASHNDQLYNDFKYNQDVHALYATYSKRISNFGIQVGLRGEYTKIDTRTLGFMENESDVTPFKDDYFSLYPSAFLSYALPNNNELQLNYTRRVSRPRGGQLNPFINITDSANISYGNPYLTPQYSNSIELNYIKNWDDHMISASLYYRNTNDVIQRINYLQDNVMMQTFENIANTQSTGAEFIVKNNFFRRIDLTTSVNLYYNKLDGFTFMPPGASSPVIGEGDDNFAWSGRMVANTILPYDISFQVTGNYNSRRVISQGYQKPSGSVDIGIRKSFFDKKLTLTVSARDILDTRKRTSVTSGSGFSQQDMYSRQGQTFNFTLTYSFGNMSSKKNGNNGNGNANALMGDEEEY